jgi:hypothetical protein
MRLLFLSYIIKNQQVVTNLNKKGPNTELHENSELGSYAVPCGQTDGHDEASSHLS